MMKKMIRNQLTQQNGFALMIVVGFMALAVPLLTSALALGGALSKDSGIKFNIAKNQYSSAAGREYISFLSDDPTTWGDWIDETGGVETLTINDDTVEVTGDQNGTSSNGALDFCVFGDNSVEIKERVNIQCSIASNGNITIKENATVTGNVASGANVILGEDASVTGDVSAAGSITLGTNASVGSSSAGITWTPISGATPNYDVNVKVTDQSGDETNQSLSVSGGPLPLTFNLTAGGPDVTVNSGQSYSAVPGSNGTLLVNENATISFVSDDYAYQQATIKENVTINLTKLTGPIVVDVVGGLEFKEDITMTVVGGTAADVAFRVGNDIVFKENGQYVGTYFTPISMGGLLTLKEDSTLTGAILGTDVRVKEDSTVIGMPSISAYLSFFE